MGRKSLLLIQGLVVLTLALLALVGCSTGEKYGKNGVIRLGVVEFNQSVALEQALNGVIESVQESELAKQVTIHIDWADAGGQRLAIRPIIDKFEAEEIDLIIALSTPCLESAIRQVTSVPFIFGVAINPIILGLNRGEEGYWRNISGIYAEPPLEHLCVQIRQLLPEAKSVGVIWNPSEINSRYEMLALRKATRKMNLDILDVRIREADTIAQKASDLLTMNPDVIVLLWDYTVTKALPELEQILMNSKTPVFSDIPMVSDSMAVLINGYDMFEWGKATGAMVVRALTGTPLKDLPVQQFTDLKTVVNMKNANRLGIKIPPDILESADKVIK